MRKERSRASIIYDFFLRFFFFFDSIEGLLVTSREASEEREEKETRKRLFVVLTLRECFQNVISGQNLGDFLRQLQLRKTTIQAINRFVVKLTAVEAKWDFEGRKGKV